MEFISFQLIERKPKTDVFEVINEKLDVRLGIVKWYSQWRQYCFFPKNDTLYHHACLSEIAEFINELNNAHKKRRKENKLLEKSI